MSRVIKFRAWDKVDRVYLGSAHPAFTSSISFEDCRGKMITKAKNKAIIFEQYTGLKDKNGKEIYEGDIVRYADDYEENAEVVFDDGGFQVEWPINIERLEGDITCMMEVIGNIHENKELLGGKE